MKQFRVNIITTKNFTSIEVADSRLYLVEKVEWKGEAGFPFMGLAKILVKYSIKKRSKYNGIQQL